MRRLITAALTAAALTLTGAAAATPALAAPATHCGDVDYTVTPNEAGTPSVSDDGHTVAVGATYRTVTFNVVTDEDSPCTEWEIFVGHGASDAIAHPTWFRPTVKIAASKLHDFQAGANYPLLVRVRQPGGNFENTDDSIRFVRRASFGKTFNASPEPLRDGGTLNFTGVIYRASWDLGAYRRYGGRIVSLVRDDVVLDQTLQADANGLLTGNRKHVHYSSVWRLDYFGNSTTGSAFSRGDYVQVNVVDED